MFRDRPELHARVVLSWDPDPSRIQHLGLRRRRRRGFQGDSAPGSGLLAIRHSDEVPPCAENELAGLDPGKRRSGIEILRVSIESCSAIHTSVRDLLLVRSEARHSRNGPPLERAGPAPHQTAAQAGPAGTLLVGIEPALSLRLRIR